MSGTRVQYQCPAPSCLWVYERPWPYSSFKETEQILRQHIDTHRIYRHVMRFRVWRLQRRLARKDYGQA